MYLFSVSNFCYLVTIMHEIESFKKSQSWHVVYGMKINYQRMIGVLYSMSSFKSETASGQSIQ